MNLNDLYEMRDPRDAYERDVANSTGGFGKNSQAYRSDGGANDENHALDQQSSTWYIRLNGKLIKDKSGNPYSFQDKAAANKAAQTMQAKLFNKDKEFMLTTNPTDKVAEIVDYDTLNQLASHPMAGPLVAAGGAAIGGAIGGGIKKTVDYFQKRKEQKAQAQRPGQQGMAEGSQRVDSLVTDALKIMQGSDVSDAVKALKTVIGDREYNERRGHYSFYVRQLIDMYGQQGVAEGEVDSDGYSIDHADSGEYDYEGDQARDQMNTIVRAARRLDGLLDDNENMPEWVQMKVTLAADYLDTAADYIESNQEPELDEGERGRGRPPLGQQDTTPVIPGRIEKTATGIRHHADASRYGGTEPDDDEDDYLMSKSHISRLGKMTEPDIDEGEKVGNMDADKFDSAMSRLKQLAGAGPMKTVWDPTKRVYRNVPTAVQPRK